MNSKEVKELCIKLLPSYQIPEMIEIVDKIEKNASGKIIRKKS
jgi:acyl-CoA synthetase (AMP-forming)/AMP-acid ligase II